MTDYGKIEFKGAIIALEEHAGVSYRVYYGGWSSATDGETYLAEYVARGIADNGDSVLVTWQFPLVRGVELEDEGELLREGNVVSVSTLHSPSSEGTW